MKELSIPKRFRSISVSLLLTGLLISLLPYLPLSELISKSSIQSSIVPLLWSILCAVIWIFIPRLHPVKKVMKQDSLLFDAMFCSILLLGCRLGAAFILDGFGKSPYDMSIGGIRNNLILILPDLVAKELIRYYFLCTFCRKGTNKAFIFITLLISASNLSYSAILQINDAEALVTFIARYLGPEVSRNLILSYFSLYGGPAASILYTGIITGFMQFFPILPNLKWITEGVISITVPVLETYYITGKYNNSKGYRWAQKESLASMAGWTVTLAASVAFIWFVVGVFPVYPSVIATGSMKPMINEGDVILIQKPVKEEDILSLKEGEVIQFTRDDILITHRILQIIKDENGNISFQTKGDNNSVEDARLVLPNEVRGTLVRVIPKAGIPTLWIKSREEDKPKGVEF